MDDFTVPGFHLKQGATPFNEVVTGVLIEANRPQALTTARGTRQALNQYRLAVSEKQAL